MFFFDPVPGVTLNDFADFVEEFRQKPCPEAVAWLRTHDWTNVDEAPLDFAYHLLLEFKEVQGPIFRAGTIQRIGDSPFWSARAWMTINGLTREEYHFLFARAWPKEQFRERVLNGSLEPGSRAIVR